MESKFQSLQQAMGIVRESVLILPSNKNMVPIDKEKEVSLVVGHHCDDPERGG
jgi:hypothetical protein